MSAIVSNFNGPYIQSRQIGVPSGAATQYGNSLVVQRLPTEPVGTTIVTFDGVVAGSALFIQSQDGTTAIHNSTAPGGSFAITLSVYSAGSPLNDWRIKVRKASGTPNYIPYETLMTATVGTSSIYVSQIPDE